MAGDQGWVYYVPNFGKAITRYATVNGLKIWSLGSIGDGASVPAKAESVLAVGNPVLIEVKNDRGGNHFVLADGRAPAIVSATSARGTYTLKDPGYRKTRLIQYKNVFTKALACVGNAGGDPGQAPQGTDAATDVTPGLSVVVGGHVTVSITDPLNRAISYDPGTGEYVGNIPGAIGLHWSDENDDSTVTAPVSDSVLVFELPGAPDGQYSVTTNGEAAGDVGVSATMFDNAGAGNRAGALGPTSQVSQQVFVVTYARSSGTVSISAMAPTAVHPAGLQTGPGLRVLENPARGPVRFALAADRASQVDLSIYDVSGRKVGGFSSIHAWPGVGTLSWDPAQVGATSGIYFAKMRAGPRTWVVRFAVIR